MSGLFPVSLLPALILVLVARAGCSGEPWFLAPDSPRGLEIHAALCRDLGEGLSLLEGEALDEENWDFFLFVIAKQHGEGGRPLCEEIGHSLLYQRCMTYMERPHMWSDARSDIEDCPTLEAPDPDDPTDWCACTSDDEEGGEPRISTDVRGVEPHSQKEAIKALVAANLGRLMACYRSDLANCPCPDDSLVLEATVQDGELRVTEAWEGPLSRHQGRAGCVGKSMRNWMLPEGFSGSFTVHYRLQTEAASAAAP